MMAPMPARAASSTVSGNGKEPSEASTAPRAQMRDMDLADLETIKARISRKIKLEKQKANPLFIDLLDEDYKLDFSDIEKKYKSDDIFRDYFVSKDGRELILLVKPSGLAGNLDFSRKLLAQAEAAVARTNPAAYHASIKVSYTGRFKKQIDLNDQLQRDLKYTGAGALALVILLLVAYFRQVRPLLLILPGEFPFILRLELVAQRPGVVVIVNPQGITGRQGLPFLHDKLMPPRWHD